MTEQKRRILIVEDDQSVVELVAARLEHEGFEVLSAMDGEEGLKRATEHGPIDLILLDVKLPKLDGFGVCKRLKERPTTTKIPVIIVTGTSRDQANLADRCLELGVHAWLTKPLESKQLLRCIRQALKEVT